MNEFDRLIGAHVLDTISQIEDPEDRFMPVLPEKPDPRTVFDNTIGHNVLCGISMSEDYEDRFMPML